MRIASLPMYDLEELRPATDAWWRGLARAFRRLGMEEAPEKLERAIPPGEQWGDRRLLFSQTCGYPLTHELRGRVRYLATPVYDAPGCTGTNYSSAVVVRADDGARALADLAGRICGVNGRQSQSGYNALKSLVAPLAGGRPFFSAVTVTGSHLASLEALRGGRADVAAVDCVTYALFERYRPAAVRGLRILTWSAEAPALPYITAAGDDPAAVEKLREGLGAALADPDLAAARQSLLLKDIAFLPQAAYGVIDRMERKAEALGYGEIA